jgi:membrane protease YdiL (CAAX protease family)
MTQRLDNGPDDRDQQPEAGNPEPATPATEAAIWCEVLAVLCIGVFPYRAGALTFGYYAGTKRPYWVDSVALLLYAACVSYAVLYLIHRSGQAWACFGLVLPMPSDLLLGILLFLLHYAIWWRVAPFLPANSEWMALYFPAPHGSLDLALMVAKFAMSGFAEELVTRAYLITRLEHLLRSRLAAVVLSALLFASYHLYYGFGYDFLHILLLGLAYGGLYLTLRRVWPLALAHMLWNIYCEVATG